MTKEKNCGNCANYAQHFNHKDCGSCLVTHYPDNTESAPSNWKAKPMTNADKIRAMSDEELANFIGRAKEPCDYCQLAFVAGACTATLCDDAMLKWLQQPAEDE